MNYKRIHDNLIERGKNRVLEEYGEIHHIVPRCMGGIDASDNLVLLTPEEHFLVHALLVKIYPENDKLVFAANMMHNSADGKRPNRKIYGWLRRIFAETKSTHSKLMWENSDSETKERMLSGFYDTHRKWKTDKEFVRQQTAKFVDMMNEYWSDEDNRKKQSDKMYSLWQTEEFRTAGIERGKTSMTNHWNNPEFVDNHGSRMKQAWADPEYRKKMSDAVKGSRLINNGIICKKLKAGEELPEGFSYGRIKNGT